MAAYLYTIGISQDGVKYSVYVVSQITKGVYFVTILTPSKSHVKVFCVKSHIHHPPLYLLYRHNFHKVKGFCGLFHNPITLPLRMCQLISGDLLHFTSYPHSLQKPGHFPGRPPTCLDRHGVEERIAPPGPMPKDAIPQEAGM